MAGVGGPPRYKLAVVVWIAIFPTVAVTLGLLRPFVGHLPIVVQAFVLTVIVVPIAVMLLVPLVSRLLTGWLNR
jgi:uncharacterized protein